MDGFDHQLDRRVDNRPCLFRVKVLHQFRRALDIGERRGNGLPLTLDHVCCRNRIAQSNSVWVRREARGQRESESTWMVLPLTTFPDELNISPEVSKPSLSDNWRFTSIRRLKRPIFKQIAS